MEIELNKDIENMSEKDKELYIAELTKKVLEITNTLPAVKVEDMLQEDLDRWQY